jgi:hypothetical protein
LAAGIILSALVATMQARQGGPSELAQLERRTAENLGWLHSSEQDAPTIREEAVGHAGHLALSALAGAGYGLATRGRERSPVLSGLAFGLGFHLLAYGMVGPALGVTPKPWRDSPSNQLMHGGLHALFGIVTGVVTNGLSHRSRPAPRRA